MNAIQYVICFAIGDVIASAIFTQFWRKRCKRKCGLFTCPDYSTCEMSDVVQELSKRNEHNGTDA